MLRFGQSQIMWFRHVCARRCALARRKAAQFCQTEAVISDWHPRLDPSRGICSSYHIVWASADHADDASTVCVEVNQYSGCRQDILADAGRLSPKGALIRVSAVADERGLRIWLVAFRAKSEKVGVHQGVSHRKEMLKSFRQRFRPEASRCECLEIGKLTPLRWPRFSTISTKRATSDTSGSPPTNGSA